MPLLLLMSPFEEDMEDMTWQEFEVYVRDVLTHHDFEVTFRKVFTHIRKYQIDVVGCKGDLCICFDAKKYGRGRSRTSSLKTEALKHYERCLAYEEKYGVKAVPVIVSWLDDNLMIENGCIFVPLRALNDFLLNLDEYLEHLSFVG